MARHLISKARLAVELAAQQQLKGLIENPLKEAMVANMVEAGVTKEAAEAIAFNTMIDGYEPTMKNVMKEAFETFINQPVDEFVKVAKFTKDYQIKEANDLSSVDDGEKNSDIQKTASVGSLPLRGSEVAEGKKDVYRNYWEGVAEDRRRW